MLVRAAGVPVEAIVIRALADPGLRVWDADGEPAVLSRQPVRARIRAEVGVERPVLLHHDDDVADLVNADQGGGVRVRMALAERQPAPEAAAATVSPISSSRQRTGRSYVAIVEIR